MEQHKSPSCQRVVGRGEDRKGGNSVLSPMPVLWETSFQDPRVRKSIKKEKKVNKEKRERAEKLREEEIVKSMNVFSNYGEKLYFLSYYFPKRANVQKGPVYH